jgi:hypothetical protein
LNLLSHTNREGRIYENKRFGWLFFGF